MAFTEEGSYEKYIFVKELKNEIVNVPIGSDISVINGNILLNGGLLTPVWQTNFRRFIEKERENGWNYIKPVKPIFNKI